MRPSMRSIYKQHASYKHRGISSRSYRIPSTSLRLLNILTYHQCLILHLAMENLRALSFPTLEPLDEEDYLDVPYWHDRDWIKHSERQKDRGQSFASSPMKSAIRLQSHGSRHSRQRQNRHGTSSIVTDLTLFPGQRRLRKRLRTLHT